MRFEESRSLFPESAVTMMLFCARQSQEAKHSSKGGDFSISGYQAHAGDGEISQGIDVFFDAGIGRYAIFTE